MNPIRILIADDDEGMRLVMRKVVERAEGYELVGEAGDGRELLALYEKEKPQVVMLDVEMPGMDGIECARAIQDQDPRTVLIFATAHEQYMGDAFAVYAFDYLVKPFRVERALQTLSLARERLEGAPTRGERPLWQAKEKPARLMIRHKDGISFIDMEQLLLVQREERATVLYGAGDLRFVTNEPLGELEARLPDDVFFRCHKSYIVNINHIDSISPYGRWTYIVKMRGTQRDALITHERFEALQKLFA